MLKFFRRIRRKLLEGGNLKRYTIYAIGEIILVVVGILIALQINNWNREREDRKLETKILREISNNLRLDLNEIRIDISLMDSVNVACDKLIEYINANDVPSEAFYANVAKLRVAPHFDPNLSGYELLTSKGVDIIRNDSLRISISSIYESSYPYYGKYEQERIQYKIHQMSPILLDHFTWIFNPDEYFKSSYKISTEDYMKIKKNGSFLKLVHATSLENRVVQDRAKRIEQQILDLFDFLKEELELSRLNAVIY